MELLTVLPNFFKIISVGKSTYKIIADVASASYFNLFVVVFILLKGNKATISNYILISTFNNIQKEPHLNYLKWFFSSISIPYRKVTHIIKFYSELHDKDSVTTNCFFQ